MTLRTVAFGDLQSRLWGVAWDAGARDGAAVLLGRGGAQPARATTLLAPGRDHEWRLSGEVELTISPLGEAAPLELGEALSGIQQLVAVRGHVAVDGDQQELDCLGVRGEQPSAATPGAYDSVRSVSAWFGPDFGLALLSARPARAAGHERDLVGAMLFEDERSIPVAEPRLSTTYGADGLPTRASVELWLDDEEEAYPRRAAGEALGAGTVTSDGLELRAELLIWHSRGRAGAGVYVLAHQR